MFNLSFLDMNSNESDIQISEFLSNVPWFIWVLIAIGLLGLVGFVLLFIKLSQIGIAIGG